MSESLRGILERYKHSNAIIRKGEKNPRVLLTNFGWDVAFYEGRWHEARTALRLRHEAEKRRDQEDLVAGRESKSWYSARRADYTFTEYLLDSPECARPMKAYLDAQREDGREIPDMKLVLTMNLVDYSNHELTVMINDLETRQARSVEFHREKYDDDQAAVAMHARWIAATNALACHDRETVLARCEPYLRVSDEIGRRSPNRKLEGSFFDRCPHEMDIWPIFVERITGAKMDRKLDFEFLFPIIHERTPIGTFGFIIANMLRTIDQRDRAPKSCRDLVGAFPALLKTFPQLG